MVDRKAATLQRKVARLLPHLQARPAFAWAGTFAETSAGLPLFGRHPQYGSRVLFALAYGSNDVQGCFWPETCLRKTTPHTLGNAPTRPRASTILGASPYIYKRNDHLEISS